jgi:3-oxoacyl-[acyl-carrier protein] reductase
VNYAAHAEAADRLAGEIAAGSGRAISVMADVADPSAVEAMVARTERELGPVTILVNNAGVSWQGTLDTYDPEQVTRMRQVNVEGLIHATRAVSGGMRAPQYGRIVNISSIAAIGTALPGNAFYAATKAEVAILTKRFALELGRGTAKAMMGRIGEPEDIANAVAFLTSPESGWITAQMVIVDGGRMDYIGHA